MNTVPFQVASTLIDNILFEIAMRPDQNYTQETNRINSQSSSTETESTLTQEINETPTEAENNDVLSPIVTTTTREEAEEAIVVISDKDTSLTCIDLTDGDDQVKDNDIIIEDTVGSITFVRQPRKFVGPFTSSSLSSSTDNRGRLTENRRRRNRLANSQPQLDATIILDDSPRIESQASQTLPKLGTSLRFPDLSPEISVANVTQDLTKPSPPKRAKFTNSFSPESKQEKTKPVKDSSESKQISCPICLETLDELKLNKKRLKSTYCGHILCSECLEQFFKASSGPAKSIQCPTCRTRLTRAKIHDLFL